MAVWCKGARPFVCLWLRLPPVSVIMTGDHAVSNQRVASPRVRRSPQMMHVLVSLQVLLSHTPSHAHPISVSKLNFWLCFNFVGE